MLKVNCDICGNFIEEWSSNQQGASMAHCGNYYHITDAKENKFNFQVNETWKDRHWCINCFYKILKEHMEKC